MQVRLNVIRVAVLVVAVGVAACGVAPPGPEGIPALAPTADEVRSLTYRGLMDLPESVTLSDGRWQGTGDDERTVVTLASAFSLTGDLDGNDGLESVVVLSQNSGGSGTINYVAVIGRGPDGPRNVATEALGDRVAIRDARIADGVLQMSVVRAGPEDAMCCPGEMVNLAWRLSDGRLVDAVSPVVTGRLSIGVLKESTWVLKAWSLDEAAPPSPEVTLQFADNRATGTSGCNTYTASVAPGDLPGDLTFGAAATTRMACPDPDAAVESRYLTGLARVRKFGFMLGDLILHYDDHSGVSVMRFGRR